MAERRDRLRRIDAIVEVLVPRWSFRSRRSLAAAAQVGFLARASVQAQWLSACIILFGRVDLGEHRRNALRSASASAHLASWLCGIDRRNFVGCRPGSSARTRSSETTPTMGRGQSLRWTFTRASATWPLSSLLRTRARPGRRRAPSAPLDAEESIDACTAHRFLPAALSQRFDEVALTQDRVEPARLGDRDQGRPRPPSMLAAAAGRTDQVLLLRRETTLRIRPHSARRHQIHHHRPHSFHSSRHLSLSAQTPRVDLDPHHRSAYSAGVILTRAMASQAPAPRTAPRRAPARAARRARAACRSRASSRSGESRSRSSFGRPVEAQLGSGRSGNPSPPASARCHVAGALEARHDATGAIAVAARHRPALVAIHGPT